MSAALAAGRNAPISEKITAPTSEGRESRLRAMFFTLVEEFLDAGDAIKRQRKANRIYADLVTQRVSTREAVGMLQALTKRQKGGWLKDSLKKREVKDN